MVLATRITSPEGITQTTGAALPVGVLSAAEREELVRGRYRVAVDADDLSDRWATVEAAIAEQYPTLRVVRSGAMRLAGEGKLTLPERGGE